MPDNKGWRKRKPQKELPPLKVVSEKSAPYEDPSERRRHHSWRKTISGIQTNTSRPQTPVSGIPATPGTKGTDYAPSERSETSPRRGSKPKLARYASLFSSFKEASKAPDFAEPWSEHAPPAFEPCVDPLTALQSIRSYMIRSCSEPIPLHYHSGLFCIFDDYCRVRQEKEQLETLTQHFMRDWEKAEDQWSVSEMHYEAEIRRLDLIIAQGTSGMTGLMKARQGSVVDRRRLHRKTSSDHRPPPVRETLSSIQLDEEIKLRSSKALLRRPVSPSGKMTALSRHFTRELTSISIDVPLLGSKKPTLSYKGQSELNLSSHGTIEAAHRRQVGGSFISESSSSIGDALSDEVMLPDPEFVQSPVECDAFIALRELGTLVARRRGINVEDFLGALINLFSITTEQGSGNDGRNHEEHEIPILKPALQGFQSQPLLSSGQRRHRHFSFEVGDDQLDALEEGLKLHGAAQPEGNVSDSDTLLVVESERHAPLQSPLTSTPSSQNLNVDPTKPSKIPSPVQVLGRMRRETSVSSLRSHLGGPMDGHGESCSSIRRLFQENPDTKS